MSLTHIITVLYRHCSAQNHCNGHWSSGGANKAIAENFTATSNFNGTINVQFTGVTGNAMVDGIEITPGNNVYRAFKPIYALVLLAYTNETPARQGLAGAGAHDEVCAPKTRHACEDFKKDFR
jgi:hypothetical protein